jgi:SAM-dependent methyltransferase
MSTASKGNRHRRQSAHYGSYRQSHLGVGKARSYDEDLWDLKAAKGLEWLVEQRLLTGILQELAAGGSCSSADFACGTGRVLEFLGDHFISVTGIDISPEMLELARSRCPRAHLIQGDVTTNHGLARGPFDLITAFRFFLNAEPVLRSQALDWMRRSLRQGGAVIANFHLNPTSLRGTYLRLRTAGATTPTMMSIDQARQLFEAHGFTVLDILGYSFLPYRRDGRTLIAPSARRLVEMHLAGCRALLPVAGSFIVVAALDYADGTHEYK